MHSIERYGIVALLFLVVTVVAVLMWDGGKEAKKAKGALGTAPAPTAQAVLPGAARPRGEATQPGVDAAQRRADAEGRRLSLVADSQPGPLTRQGRRAEREQARAEEEAELPRTLPGEDTLVPEEAPPSAQRSAPAASLPSQTPSEQPAREEVIGQVPAGGSRAYRVQPGDTLSEIAQRELGSARRWKDLVAANPGLDPAKLQVGKSIRIPGEKANAAGASPVEASALAARPSAGKPAVGKAAEASTPSRTWKVKTGESLWKIAEQSLGDGKRWREIAALNPKLNPDRLVLGQVLVLPGATRASASAPKASAPRESGAPLVATRQASTTDTRRGGKVK